jgi:DNA-binding GntR family transcriptional regulator
VKASNPIGLGVVDEVVPLHEIVYQRLTRALMAGQIAPRRKLTSRKLAQELGTSDMPVRAALLRLQSLKALSQLPNGSLTLPSMTRQHFADLMDTRVLCEGAATERAAQIMPPAAVKALKKACTALTRAARSQDIDAYLEWNYEFKFQIYRTSQSESLVFIIEMLWLQVGPFLRQHTKRFAGDLSPVLELDYHEEALAAIERRDAKAAGRAIRRDIAEGARFLVEHGDFS